VTDFAALMRILAISGLAGWAILSGHIIYFDLRLKAP